MSRMNTVARRFAGAGLALAMGVSTVSFARAQEQPQQERQQVQTIQGAIEDVDTEAKALMIRPAEGPALRILYTDKTEVTGARGGVAGLAEAAGRQVLVQFAMEGGARVASSIELLPQR